MRVRELGYPWAEKLWREGKERLSYKAGPAMPPRPAASGRTSSPRHAPPFFPIGAIMDRAVTKTGGPGRLSAHLETSDLFLFLSMICSTNITYLFQIYKKKIRMCEDMAISNVRKDLFDTDK